MDSNKPIVAIQPFKALYLTIRLLRMIGVLPYLALRFAVRAWRPQPTWSWSRSLQVTLTRNIIDLLIKVHNESKRNLTIEVQPHELKDARFVWIDPVHENSILGEIKLIAQRCGVRPVRIPAYWLGKGLESREVDQAGNNERTVLYFHGGGFVDSSAHPADPTSNVPKGILQHSQSVTRLLSVDYRLSTAPPRYKSHQNPFPAALLDALAAYSYLVKVLGFSPHNIIISGDSAGANLAMALTRYLVEFGSNPNAPDPSHPVPPPPSGLLLFAPWADVSNTHSALLPRHGPHLADFIHAPNSGRYAHIIYASDAYRGYLEQGEVARNPYLSPASRSLDPVAFKMTSGRGLFEGFPRVYISYGGAEMFANEIQELEKRMREDLKGDLVMVDRIDDGAHDFCVFPWYEPERTQTLQRVAKWIDVAEVA